MPQWQCMNGTGECASRLKRTAPQWQEPSRCMGPPSKNVLRDLKTLRCPVGRRLTAFSRRRKTMNRSRRARFVKLCVALLAYPLGLRAQQRERTYRIGFLGNAPLTAPDSARLNEIFVQSLRERGYNEGANLVIERR